MSDVSREAERARAESLVAKARASTRDFSEPLIAQVERLLALVEQQEKALRGIAEYEPTPEVTYDEFAYLRMVGSFKQAAAAALSGGSDE